MVLLNVVHFSRCVTSSGDFQRVVFARSPHRSASLLGVRVERRSCRDCRHQCARGSFDSELVLLGGDNIVCGARKCTSLQCAASFSRRHSDFIVNVVQCFPLSLSADVFRFDCSGCDSLWSVRQL